MVPFQGTLVQFRAGHFSFQRRAKPGQRSSFEVGDTLQTDIVFGNRGGTSTMQKAYGSYEMFTYMC